MEAVEEYIKSYPFLQYINEDKSRYKHAKDAGYYDPDDLFLVGDSGGFLLNIRAGYKFVNTHLFTEAADYYRLNNVYTMYAVDSIPHRQFRKREEKRRRHGYTAPCLQTPDGEIIDVRITGSHYNFLNYTLMEQLDEGTIKQGANSNSAEKKQDFSKFIDAQYWTFHIMEFVVNNGYHLIIDKTRRGGFSYIMAADTANTLNLNSKKVGIHVAADKKYLTKTGGLTDFAINNLKFYEHNTPFIKGVISSDKEDYRLGFKLPNGVESPQSWHSAMMSVSALNNPDCAIGKDARSVKVEELSTMDNFDQFMEVTEPALRTGSYTTGNLIAWGTATSGNMQTFEQNFYNPLAYNFMPFENVWDKDSRSEICGYFKPYAWGLQGEHNGVKAMDKDGNSNLEIALLIANDERKKKKESAKRYSEYINYLGQYALMPCESFSSTTENMFIREELVQWEERLRTDNSFKFYSDGNLYENEKGEVAFKTNERIAAEGGKINVDFYEWITGVPRKAHEHPHGCIRMWFSPMKIDTIDKKGRRSKSIPDKLYSISYDPVGINKENKGITTKHSHNSIKVWMNPHPSNNYIPKLVAAYYGRPERLEEADYICYLLAKFYNCVGTTGVEVNRGETITNFTKWNALRYLEKQEIDVWDNSIKGSTTTSYGYVIGDGSRKLDALRLLEEMLYTVVGKDEFDREIKVYQTIYDYQTILEIKKWNSVGNFDRVSELIIRGIQWRAMDVAAARKLLHRKKVETGDGYNDNIMNRSWYQ